MINSLLSRKIIGLVLDIVPKLTQDRNFIE